MMFIHIFKNRLKCLVRSRQLIFWTLMFPLVLAVFFNLAFSNMSSGENFQSIPVAVVNNPEYRQDKAFQEALRSVSDRNKVATEKLFHVSNVTKQQAKESLARGTIKGYILFNNGAHVVVKASDTDQTILKEFVDSYLQTASAYRSILSKYPAGASTLITTPAKEYIKNVAPAKTSADGNAAYFYALIAMAVMFGGYWGKKEVEDIQADLSPVGARINLAPVHKLKAFASSLCASVCVEFFCLLILIAFLTFGLNINFGNQVGYIIAICFLGSITGVSFGALIAAVVRGPSHLKTSVMLALSMLLSCLAGLMSLDLKYTVTHAVPVMAYINPANLISDSLYSLYYYSSHIRFFINMGCLGGLAIIFCTIVYLVLRRRKYASL